MPFFKTSDEVNIFYQVKGEGKAIILAHGWAANHTAFLPQLEELSRNHKVIIYDHRGHNKSDKPETGLTLYHLSKDLMELFNHLELDNVILIGWSMGAKVIFEYIKNFGLDKISGIGLFDMTPKIINDKEWKLGLYHGAYFIEDALMDMAAMCDSFRDFQNKFIEVLTPYLTENLRIKILNQFSNSSPHGMLALWLSMVRNDYRDVLERITVPSFVAYGDKSTLYSSETAYYIHSKLPNSKLICFENCTHALVMEDKNKTNEVIKELIKSL